MSPTHFSRYPMTTPPKVKGLPMNVWPSCLYSCIVHLNYHAYGYPRYVYIIMVTSTGVNWSILDCSTLSGCPKWIFVLPPSYPDDPKLKDLVYELKEVDWKQLGIQLNVPRHILRNIDRENPGNESRKLSEVLQYWIDNAEPAASW